MILVVEDDILNQKLISFYLRNDYQMCFAVSVSEAKQMLEKHSPAIVLLDLSLLGGEDGLDLCLFIKNSSIWKDTPVVAVTAHAFSETKRACDDAGCDDYMTKPVKKDELLAMIEKHMHH